MTIPSLILSGARVSEYGWVTAEMYDHLKLIDFNRNRDPKRFGPHNLQN